jgi:hypothetical protein
MRRPSDCWMLPFAMLPWYPRLEEAALELEARRRDTIMAGRRRRGEDVDGDIAKSSRHGATAERGRRMAFLRGVIHGTGDWRIEG